MVEELRLKEETMSQKIVRAIKKGAPLFNKGDKKACFDIYLDTAKKIQAKDMLDLDVANLLSQAVPEAESLGENQDNIEGAWVLRRCFDKILKIEVARVKEEKRIELLELATTIENTVEVADRKHLLKTYDNCFVGKDAVSKLVETGISSSRGDATKKLSALEKAGFIEHVTRDHGFEDAKLFYRFNPDVKKSLESSEYINVTDVAPAESEPTSEQPNDESQDQKAFTENEEEEVVVESVPEAKSDEQDEEEVSEATESTTESTVEEVNNDPQEEATNKESPQADNDEVDVVLEEEIHIEVEDPMSDPQKGDSQNEEKQTTEDVDGDVAVSTTEPVAEEFHDEAREEEAASEAYEKRVSNTSANSLSTPNDSGEHETEQELVEFAKKMEWFLDIADRKHRLKTYESCFIGKDAVTKMVDSDIAASRSEATEMMKDLCKAGFVEHVTGDHDFEDAKFFYRFTTNNVNTASSFAKNDENTSSSFSKPATEKVVDTENLSLTELAALVKQTVDIADRKHRLKTYKECFVGKDAVTKLVEGEVFVNRTEATRQLVELRRAGFIEHVTGEHDFEDAPLFYRFTAEAKSSVRSLNNEF